jgi:hypothetical protein
MWNIYINALPYAEKNVCPKTINMMPMPLAKDTELSYCMPLLIMSR